jgi:hypothetical protein
VVGAIYLLRAIRAMLHGPLPEKWDGVTDAAHFWRKMPYGVLLASLLVFGFFPRLLTDKIGPSVSEKVLSPATQTASTARLGRAAFAGSFDAEGVTHTSPARRPGFMVADEHRQAESPLHGPPQSDPPSAAEAGLQPAPVLHALFPRALPWAGMNDAFGVVLRTARSETILPQ